MTGPQKINILLKPSPSEPFKDILLKPEKVLRFLKLSKYGETTKNEGPWQKVFE